MEPSLQEIGAYRRRHHRQVPPPRRSGSLRHHRPHGPGLQHALSPRGRPGQLRLPGRRPTGGDALHRDPYVKDRRRDSGGSRKGHGRFRAQLRRIPYGTAGHAGQDPHDSSQRHRRHRRGGGDEHPPAQSPGGGRWDDRLDPQSRADHRRTHRLHPRAGLPDGGIHQRPGGHPLRLPHRPGEHPDPRPGHDRAQRPERPGEHRRYGTSLPGK